MDPNTHYNYFRRLCTAEAVRPIAGTPGQERISVCLVSLLGAKMHFFLAESPNRVWCHTENARCKKSLALYANYTTCHYIFKIIKNIIFKKVLKIS